MSPCRNSKLTFRYFLMVVLSPLSAKKMKLDIVFARYGNFTDNRLLKIVFEKMTLKFVNLCKVAIQNPILHENTDASNPSSNLESKLKILKNM